MTLADQQQALLRCVFDVHPGEADTAWATQVHPQGRRGLQAYRANAHASAHRSLAAAYPIVQRILGEVAFSAMAIAHWHACPPTRGDLAHWGAELPAWLDQDTQLQELPYLEDVARIEWALHRMQFDADTTPAPETFALLSQNPGTADSHTLLMASGFQPMALSCAAGSVVQVHQESRPDWSALRQRLEATGTEYVLLWRQHWQPRLKLVHCPAEFACLTALARGDTLNEALAVATAEDKDFDFSQWLSAAVADGLVLGLSPAGGLAMHSSTPRH
ncbi:DNA-binding domain-containing protein [Hydrogenophaga sp. 5NK40-0174]|uniref:DNA-binding domain-containing protein n=1 Tax=Hydrogenophaga sp. 5NK40-0174 TaxID=3127649 RepID=UPI0031022202